MLVSLMYVHIHSICHKLNFSEENQTPSKNVAPQEMVPALNTLEPIKCTTSCGKEAICLAVALVPPVRYKGMFSFWSQNKLAS
ncbi:hypothetical protein ZEAMMB73_Zm00001d007605 [Zea mays]|jgi:hypothetical protein|uniref:Uncharacterized protein n=1 Tax=Zea mays TaxID=4577 RepID=A0A1D6F7J7_MAIZE|nr:hypothetical protein ZEAMMB73_Zm00001d007605 [Zea mays]ONM27187.1 hypothetical protein ZEAMMB73_Zm00001d007605 [Zea mays]ONM27188.1 hypothetical protein ZEAMMB73_Zm00001d007605 [Zea mays]ONM27189.1 hypothetical protein ZEAMMB73_Zm00001d007605 [Zea mays]ONM27190.1 hypothetical protein ZEAMMB73_Zm00001d007605 [Zea mays]